MSYAKPVKNTPRVTRSVQRAPSELILKKCKICKQHFPVNPTTLMLPIHIRRIYGEPSKPCRGSGGGVRAA